MNETLVHEPFDERDATVAVSGEWTSMQWFFVLAWPVLVAAASLYAAAPRVLGVGGIQGELAIRAPIAILDVDGIIAKHLGPGATDANLKAGQDEAAHAARKLGKAGYVVFNASNVYAYPSARLVSP